MSLLAALTPELSYVSSGFKLAVFMLPKLILLSGAPLLTIPRSSAA